MLAFFPSSKPATPMCFPSSSKEEFMRPILESLLRQHRARLEVFLQRVSTAPRKGATDDDSDQQVVVKDIIIKEG